MTKQIDVYTADGSSFSYLLTSGEDVAEGEVWADSVHPNRVDKQTFLLQAEQREKVREEEERRKWEVVKVAAASEAAATNTPVAFRRDYIGTANIAYRWHIVDADGKEGSAISSFVGEGGLWGEGMVSDRAARKAVRSFDEARWRDCYAKA